MKQFLTHNPKTSLFCLGCLSALAMAPVYAWPLMMIGYGVLVYVLARTSKWQQTATYGFVFFFGYFLTSLYWVSSSLFVDFDTWWWALPFSFMGLPFLLALFPTTTFGVLFFLTRSSLSFTKWTRRLGNKNKLRANFASTSLLRVKTSLIILSLIMADIARGHLFTGFPWNLPAHTWAHTDVMMATLPHIGFWGLNTLTIILLCLPVLLKNKYIIGVYFIVLVVISLITLPPKPSEWKHKISLIQANIPQHEKWDRDYIWRNFNRYISMSKKVMANTQSNILIWPETAISQNMLFVPEINNALSNFLSSLPENGILITGYLNYDGDKPLNSVAIFNRDGEIISQYNKHHLVPFGEYMPFGLETITGFYNFEKGEGAKTITIKEQDVTLSPAICYESIFPKYFSVTTESSVILNITNDAWFGNTAGPYQHFDHILFRTAETGTPAIRLSGNGISGFIQSNGQPLSLSRFNHQMTLSNN